MLQLPGYVIHKKIDTSEEHEFYEGYSFEEEKDVLIRLIKSDVDVSFSKREYLAPPHTSLILFPQKIENKNGLIFEIYDSVPFQMSLASLLKIQSLTMDEFLFVARNLASILLECHQQKMIIGSLNPHCILIDFAQQKVYLLHNYTRTVHSFFYSSPEFTGRMGRKADFRSDLYSLGMIFYEMLTNQYPFPNTDLLEILHSHFTRTPASPTTVNAAVPSQLSHMTLKLLEKSPEKRYQSAYGLKSDLDKCSEQWLTNRKLGSFPLGENDIAYIEKRKLFGRGLELERLTLIYERVKTGQKEFVLLKGSSGSGKTALVHAFEESIKDEQVIFAAGKWDQFERNIPYAPIIQAFKTLFRIIIAQGDTRIQMWQERFLHRLGHRCQIILDLIPEFSWIIGTPIFKEEIGGFERHNSILITFQQILSIITEETPIVLFIDDIQWADQPSIDLLRYLAVDSEPVNLLVILASRNEQEQSARALMNLQLIDELTIEKLSINPLDEAKIQEWLSQNYHFKQDLGPLSSYVYHLSQGNPFFIQQILLTLEKEKYIFLNQKTNAYEYLIGKYPRVLIGKDVISLLGIKLDALPRQVETSLKYASSLGTMFTLTDLSLVTKIPKDDLINDLYLLVEEGFIYFAQNQNYGDEIVLEFIHDKIQQAVYMNIEEAEKNLMHYEIGITLLKQMKETESNERLFQITDHLNLCLPLLSDQEKRTLVFYNARAGEYAKNAAAFEAAYRYFSIGKELLEEDSWKSQYDLSYQIYFGLGQCAYLNSEFEMAEQAFETLLNNCQTNEDKMAVYNLKLVFYTHLNQVDEAVDSGTKGLSLFGWKLDKPIRTWKIVQELLLIQLSTFGKKTEDLLKLPPMKNNQNRLIMESLISMNAPTYHVNQNLATYLMLRAFRYTLKHGDTDITALVYNNYSLILSAGFGNFDKSYQFGELAKAHAERSQSTKLKARVLFVFGCFVNHWKNPIAGSLDLLKTSQKLNLEVGNFHVAGACSSFIILTKMIMGAPIEKVLDEIEGQSAFVHKVHYKISMNFITESKEWLDWLRNKSSSKPTTLYDYQDDPSASIIHNTIRLQMYYIMGEHDSVKNIIDELNRTVSKALVLVIAPEFYFYHSLWLCKLYHEESGIQQREMRKYLRRNLKTMKKWAEQSPHNYQHKYLLMKMETDQVLGSGKVDHLLYSQALEQAIQSGFHQDAAIISECAANHYAKGGFSRLTNYYVNEAYEWYRTWGADRKVKELMKQYPAILGRHRQTIISSGLDIIDLEALLKASTAISSEIVLEILVDKVMDIMIENAGATNGHLYLMDGNELCLVNGLGKGEKRTLFETKDHAPMQLLQYVQKSKEPLILQHACEEGLFKHDPYIQKNKVSSIICFPLLQQNQLVGILYLENQLLSHAFSEKNLVLLSTLASQAAISIQNARLYNSLEQKVKSRTIELEKVNASLEKANQELENAEKERMKLLSNISHDLRNPLTSIQGYIEAMLDGIVISPEKQITYLQRSKEKLHALNRLIEDLFELSKLQYGNMTFVKEIVNVEKLFHHLCDQHEWDIRQHGLIFSRSMDAPINGFYPMIEVDIGRIEQVFTNIISNSLKHTIRGEIRAHLHLGETYVTFKLSDTGEGIAPDEVEQIFERSFSGTSSIAQSGNGLGLSISKEIIHHHQGEIWVESVLGKGATIFFTIPILPVEMNIQDGSEELEIS
ncbi:AAA family ATPase [Robertmurraya andreesenii]|uniref:histidine kinase n=1 Tax=Anoxybacillus andreesenii TaxID=1325932 RepID=A0ABT9V6X2_9BACL|nr:AAA family ATPase [Robertmurraya andreesenii]MDQ0156703.1 putative ATPase/signal transduction histidine kinase [Robertmurraya andreesenii]